MLEWLKGLFRFEPAENEPEYKIIHDPRLGYIACWWDFSDWWGLTEHGTDCVDIDTAMDPFYGKKLWCETEAEAGKRINLHATRGGRKTVWVSA